MKKKGAFLTLLFAVALFSYYSILYFRSYYFLVPIELVNSYQIPCTSIEIEGNRYQVEIDLGTKMALSLHKEVLDKVRKNLCGTSRRMDFRGNKYETPLYSISNVKIGSVLLNKVKTREESSEFAGKEAILLECKNEQNAGRIGRDFFTDKNIFMDFSHRILIVCSQLKDIEKEGYEMKRLTSTPFKVTSDGIILEIETDLGKQKFVLDTGTTVSAIRSRDLNNNSLKQSSIGTSKFVINGTDFGSRELYLLDISQEFNEIDGLLGMDFLKDHLVYLDFNKKTAYIGKSAWPLAVIECYKHRRELASH